MKLSNKQRHTLSRLDHYLSKRGKKIKCNDAGFYRSVSVPKKRYSGRPLNGEEAYFVHTDRGEGVPKELCTDWERYKELMIGHRLFSMTIAMWRQDIIEPFARPICVISIRELREDGFTEEVDAILNSISPSELLRRATS